MAENIAALLTVASTPKTISKVGVATKATPNPNTTESSWFGYYRLAGSISGRCRLQARREKGFGYRRISVPCKGK